MTDKLRKKIERQNAKTERLLGNYSHSQKSSTTRQSGFYRHTFVDRIKL